MQSMADVARYTPGLTMGQGEGNRDQPTIRGNSTTAGFFVNGMRDDVQYFRDLYNVERVEALKGANALIFGRGVGGGVLNRVTKAAGWTPTRELSLQGGSYGNRRGALDVGQGVSEPWRLRLNGMYENSDLYRDDVERRALRDQSHGHDPAYAPGPRCLRVTSTSRTTAPPTGGSPRFTGAPLATATPRTFFGDPSQSYCRCAGQCRHRRASSTRPAAG